MKQLSFKTQIYISLAVLVCAFLAGQVFRMGIFHNIAWILIGLLFVLNPVWPKAVDWRDHNELRKGMRIGGLLVIVVFGLWVHYGV